VRLAVKITLYRNKCLFTYNTIDNPLDKKAFDKVSHNRRNYKLKLYGFSKDIITWIQDFLKDRKFKSKSKCKLLSMGQCNK